MARALVYRADSANRPVLQAKVAAFVWDNVFFSTYIYLTSSVKIVRFYWGQRAELIDYEVVSWQTFNNVNIVTSNFYWRISNRFKALVRS